MSDETIELDDAIVVEYRDALAKKITQRALDVLDRSLRQRGLQKTWERATTDKDGFLWEPPLGVAWATWFDVLMDRGLAVTPAFELLAEAGVLPSLTDPDARELVWHVRGWT